MMENQKLEELERLCLKIRKEIAGYVCQSGRGHISSALSMVEILTVLYFGINMDLQKIKTWSMDRDRVILSKGHAGLALYTVLASAGVIEKEALDGFASAEGALSTHPVFGTAAGIEMSAGSLGQGLGFACGAALAEKMRRRGYQTYVITGDGELQEGSNWESMLFASQMQLNGLTLIIDRNGLQITGKVDDIVSVSPLKEKLTAFGFYTLEIDGHSLQEIESALKQKSGRKPKAIIANTVKGKGIPFIENKDGWHGKGLTLQQYQEYISGLER